MTADYHIHTARCKHAAGEMISYVENGRAKGLLEMGFSDHAPAVDGFDPDHRMGMDEFPGYYREFEGLKAAFGDIVLRFGIETDIYPGFDEVIRMLKNRARPEFTIGSVHSVMGVSVFSEGEHPLIRNEAGSYIKAYFDLFRDGLRSGLVSVIGHLDVVKWVLPGERERIRDGACALLRDAREEGLILELNTSGLRKKPLEMYPSPELIREAAKLKIPVCLGSDAHMPGEVGSHFSEAEAILSGAGYRGNGLSGPIRVYTA